MRVRVRVHVRLHMCACRILCLLPLPVFFFPLFSSMLFPGYIKSCDCCILVMFYCFCGGPHLVVEIFCSLFLASVHICEGVPYVHIVPMTVAVFPLCISTFLDWFYLYYRILHSHSAFCTDVFTCTYIHVCKYNVHVCLYAGWRLKLYCKMCVLRRVCMNIQTIYFF